MHSCYRNPDQVHDRGIENRSGVLSCSQHVLAVSKALRTRTYCSVNATSASEKTSPYLFPSPAAKPRTACLTSSIRAAFFARADYAAFFAALTAAHLFFVASEIAFRPAALILRFFFGV